ncbi:MAG: hypothetical protein JWL98_1031 [Xanthomonadaceae bacterium]|nr:hypothetical protein [Xanthomonadaceae bacterium]
MRHQRSPLKAAPARRRTLAGVLLALAICSPAVFAGGFQVSPTIAEVPAGTKVASFELRNTGSDATTVQVDVLAWDQSDQAGDSLVPANDIIVVPRVATLEPDGGQLVRIALRHPATGEQSYRVRLREVPPPPPPGFMGVRTLIEQVVPLFFVAAGEPKVAWHATLSDKGELLLGAANSGPHYLRIVDIQLVDQRGAILADHHGPGYVLAGHAMRWPLVTHARLARGDLLSLQFKRDGSLQSVPLAVE